MYDKNEMQFYPDEKIQLNYIVAYDYFGDEIYSNSDDEYLKYERDYIKYTGSPSDLFLLNLDAMLVTVDEIERMEN